jgi:hypothetical protein
VVRVEPDKMPVDAFDSEMDTPILPGADTGNALPL